MVRAIPAPQAEEIRAIVEPISSFYALLARFPYIPASDILTPPADGWPESDVANFRKLGKTDFVVEILKHLPYIRTDGRDWRLGYDDTKAITYVAVPGAWDGAALKLAALNDKAEPEYLWANMIEPYWQRLPPHIVALTNGWQYGAWLLLDTKAGNRPSRS